jgi:hypothetical protein
MQQQGSDAPSVKAPMQMGGLQRLPRVYPSTELLARAIKRAKYVKEDTEIRNPRARSGEHDVVIVYHIL